MTKNWMLFVVLCSVAMGCGGGGTQQPDMVAGDQDMTEQTGDMAIGDNADLTPGPDMSAPPAPLHLNFDSVVLSAVHVDGAWIVAGDFTYAEMISTPKLAHIDPATGQVLSTCLGNGFDDRVNGLAQIGNSLYVVGPFQNYRGQSANRIAKIDVTTCALDTTFSPADNNGFNVDARTILASGNSLFVGGLFTTYRGASANYLAKLDAGTGALDTTFSPANSNGFNDAVLALASDGTNLFVGGAFTDYRGTSNNAKYIARLDQTTGALDTDFSPATNGFNSQVFSLVLANGALYVGGEFSAYRNVAQSAWRVAKLNPTTGAIDTTFSPPGIGMNGFDSTVKVMVASADSLYLGGNFTAYKGVAASAVHIAKLDLTSGAIDNVFNPVGPNSGFGLSVNALALVGNTLYVGPETNGSPAQYRGVSVAAGIAKLDATTGVLDTTAWKPAGHDRSGFGYGQSALTLLVSGNNLWVGGNFSNYAGKSVNRIVRFLDADGSIDRTFSPLGANGFDGTVQALAVSGNSLYVGGNFNRYRGVADSAFKIAKLDVTTGALDTTFSPPGASANGFDSEVYTIVPANNAIYVGGRFSSYRGVANSAFRIAKLDPATGALDTTFSPPGMQANGFNSDVDKLAASATALYAVGDFDEYRNLGPSSANYIAKLDLATGALDTTFSPTGANSNGFDDSTSSLAISGNSLFVGGSFGNYKSSEVHGLAKLDATTGALDTTFSMTGATGTFDYEVSAIATAGNSVFVGGGFTSYRGGTNNASYLAKLDATSGALDTTFTPSGATQQAAIQIYSLTPSGSALFIGGYFQDCSTGTCFGNAMRVNQSTRAPE